RQSPRPPTSTLFPYTTLFRSRKEAWRSQVKTRRKRRWISPLTVRILALNVPALGILLGGSLFLGQYREGLVHAKIDSLRIQGEIDRKSTRLNSSHDQISYAVF